MKYALIIVIIQKILILIILKLFTLTFVALTKSIIITGTFTVLKSTFIPLFRLGILIFILFKMYFCKSYITNGFIIIYAYIRGTVNNYVKLGYIPLSHIKFVAYIVNIFFFDDYIPDTATLSVNPENSSTSSGTQNITSKAQVAELSTMLDKKVVDMQNDIDDTEYESMGGGVYSTYKKNVERQADFIKIDMDKFKSKPMSSTEYNEFVNRINNIEKYKKYSILESIAHKIKK